MTSRPVKLKLLPRSTMKAKVVTRLTGQVEAGDGIIVEKSGGVFTVSLDSGTGAVTSVIDDTNVTGDISGHVLTLGWDGQLAIARGGTGAATAPNARTALGLGTIATQNANAVAVTGGTITGLGSPTTDTDAANKAYVDLIATGLHPQGAVLLATTAVLPNTPTYANGASGVGATLTAGANSTLTVDGTVCALNDIVLVKDQAAPAHNGIYKITTVGGGVPWILTRVVTFDTAAEITSGATATVTSGSSNTGTTWLQVSTVVTVGTDPITFTQFSASTAGVSSIGGISGAVALGTGFSTSGSTINTPWTIATNDLYFNLSGNVGIGESTPDATLHLNKAASHAALWIDGSATGNPVLWFVQAGTAKAAVQYIDSGDYLLLYNGGFAVTVYSPTDVRLPGLPNKELGTVTSTGKIIAASNVKNALLYGILNDGTEEIGTKFNQMVADLLAQNPRGGILYFPAGRYNCDGATRPLITFPVPAGASTEYSITIKGDGQGATQFLASDPGHNASCITVDLDDNRHTIHVEGCTFMATATNCYIGLYVTASFTDTYADFQRSTFRNCSFVGKNEGGTVGYFNHGLYINNLCGNSITDCNFSGVPADYTHGNGIVFIGEGTSNRTSIYNDVSRCHFHNLANGVYWATQSQGITVTQTNFGVVGCGIYAPAGGANKNQLNVVASEFDARVYPAIYILSGVEILLTNNIFILGDPNDNMVGVYIASGCSQYTINGNQFIGVGATGHVGISCDAFYGCITGNLFLNLTTGVSAGTNVGYTVVGFNNYPNVTTPVGGAGVGLLTRGSVASID